jgi:hypothetical protein
MTSPLHKHSDVNIDKLPPFYAGIGKPGIGKAGTVKNFSRLLDNVITRGNISQGRGHAHD